MLEASPRSPLLNESTTDFGHSVPLHLDKSAQQSSMVSVYQFTMKQGRVSTTLRSTKRLAETNLGQFGEKKVAMAYTRQIRSGPDSPTSPQSELTLRDWDRGSVDPNTAATRFPSVRTAHFDCQELDIPVALIAWNLPSLECIWLRTMRVLRNGLPPKVTTVVVTEPVQELKDLPSTKWIMSKHGCASLALTDIRSESDVPWDYLDRLGASKSALQCLYLNAQSRVDPLDGIKVFNCVARHHLYFLNPHGGSSILAETTACIGAMIQSRFELSAGLRVLWLDCFFASAFFLSRSTSGREVALPRSLHTLMLAVAPYGGDSMSQVSSLMAVKELCKGLRLKKLVIKLPYTEAKEDETTRQWIRAACSQFSQSRVDQIVYMPDVWVPKASFSDWRSMCGVAKSNVDVRDKPFVPTPDEALFVINDHSCDPHGA